MTDISSISFTDSLPSVSPFTSRSATVEMGQLLAQLGTVLQQARDFNGEATDLYYKLAGLVRQTQNKLDQVKRQNLQCHRKCLQHIQILLFQKDYCQALSRIDKYKKMQLTDTSFYQQINEKQPQNKCTLNPAEIESFSFQQAKAIIQNQFADFQLKEKIWIQYATQCESDQEKLSHVNYQDIEQAQIQHFKRQFNIKSQMTQALQLQDEKILTPQKKNSKSISYLKSEAKKHKDSSFKIKNVYHQKSAGKLISSKKKQSQKRTTRKKPAKQCLQVKTSKKATSPFVI